MKSRNRAYTNGEITILWRASECIHNTLCYRDLRSVFDPVKRPWVNPNGAPTDKILDIIERCPSLALTFRWNDPERNKTETSPKLFLGDMDKEFEPHESSKGAKVEIRPNGPLLISGDFTVIGSDGNPLQPTKLVSLCRCGKSGNMPYCDGTHFKIGFKG